MLIPGKGPQSGSNVLPAALERVLRGYNLPKDQDRLSRLPTSRGRLLPAPDDTGQGRGRGRLPKPALFPLDELANVVPWAALPDQISHNVVRRVGPDLVQLIR